MHNHILPGIDDGAKNVEESISLIKGFADFGVTKFVATPHIMNNVYDNTRTTINAALIALENELLEQKLTDISIAAAAEHMIDDNFENLIADNRLMPIRDQYVLVEMSYLQPPINFEESIIKLVSKRFYPILAHPERYSFLTPSSGKFVQFKEQGIMFQMNILSLGNYYGDEVAKVATKLLEDGLIDFIGSDVHNMKQLMALKDLTISNKTLRQLQPLINDTIEVFY